MDEMTNEQYSQYIGSISPKTQCGKNMLFAFLVGGGIYPKADIVMCNMRHTDADGISMAKYSSGKCTVYEASFRDVNPHGADIAANPEAWHGNTPCWQEVLQHVHLSQQTKKRANSKLRKLLGLN